MNREEIEKRFDERFLDLGKIDMYDRDGFAISFLSNNDSIKSFFLDEILPEVLRKLQFDSYDIQTIGEHYWGGDYSPSYRELNGVAESMNNGFISKAKQKYNITL